nr:MAG TPA: hypothetical protein [Caudoviricetes sp.]
MRLVLIPPRLYWRLRDSQKIRELVKNYGFPFYFLFLWINS